MADEPTGTGDKGSPLAIVTGVIAGGLTFYCMSNYIGPYRWAAELQMAVIGAYGQKLTFLLTFVAVWAAVALVALPFRRIFARDPASTPPWAGLGPGPGGSTPPIPGSVPPIPGTAPSTATAVPAVASPAGVELAPKPKRAGGLADFGLALLLMGAIFAFLGGRDYLRGSAGGTIADATVAQFEAGQPPASTWVRIAGVPLLDAGVGYGSSRSSTNLYVPLASGDNPRPPGGVRLFAKFRSKTTPSGRVEGLVTKNDLPGPVRTSMEDAGLLGKGVDHWVIEAGKDPARAQSTGRIMALIGTGMLAAGLLLNVNRFRRR